MSTRYFLLIGIYLQHTFYSEVYPYIVLFIRTYVDYYIACAKLVLVLVYCNFLKKVWLGGWDTEGLKAPTLGQYVRVCVPPYS